MDCVNKKLAPAKECYCLYPDNINKFNIKVSSILEKHPVGKNHHTVVQHTHSPKYSYGSASPP